MKLLRKHWIHVGSGLLVGTMAVACVVEEAETDIGGRNDNSYDGGPIQHDAGHEAAVAQDSATQPEAEADVVGQDAAADTAAEASEQPDSAIDVARGAADLGEACQKDLDCLEGFVCVTDQSSAFVGGGPAGGFCTVNCNSAFEGGENACDFHANAECGDLSFGGTLSAWCLPTCTLGPDGTKCKGRMDVACVKIDGYEEADPAGLCVPRCAYDGDCTGGRVCDHIRKVCVDAGSASAHDPYGTSCVPADGCGGECLSTGSAGFCSERCVFGRDDKSCGLDDGASIDDGVCIYGVYGFDWAEGDEGYCLKFCNVEGDCPAAGMACTPVGDVKTAFGFEGVCYPTE